MKRGSICQRLVQYIRFISDTLVIWSAKSKVRANSVLIVRVDTIGDFILWIESAKALRMLYPKPSYEITLLGNIIWRDLAERMDIADHFIFVHIRKFRRDLIYRYRILKQIRGQGFEIAIQPTYSRRFETGDAIIRVSGAPIRMGSIGDLKNTSRRNKTLADSWYTKLLPNNSDESGELGRNAEFVRGLGLSKFRSGCPKLSIPVSSPSQFSLKDYYIVFPASGWSARNWPLRSFAEICKRLYESTSWVGVVCGSREENPVGEALVHSSGVPMQNWMGRTSLIELVGIIKGARLLLANETGAVHIAAAVSTPSVCVLGGGHYREFLPYRFEDCRDCVCPVTVSCPMECFGCNWRCIYWVPRHESVPCIARIQVEAVWTAIENLIQEGKRLPITS
jgi:ADP-heptose:LPS heptosyltransferase